jgi:hypothetical protein
VCVQIHTQLHLGRSMIGTIDINAKTSTKHILACSLLGFKITVVT